MDGLALGLLVAVALVGLYFWVVFNRPVRFRNLSREGWSGIDVQLKRRGNLVPNLVETVRGYAGHERAVLDEVTRARAAVQGARGAGETREAENSLTAALGRLLAVAEAYPDLRADADFRSLQEQLAETENMIEKARRYYNGTVRDLNTVIEQFPSNVVASAFGFRQAAFFEIEDPVHRALPQVRF